MAFTDDYRDPHEACEPPDELPPDEGSGADWPDGIRATVTVVASYGPEPVEPEEDYITPPDELRPPPGFLGAVNPAALDNPGGDLIYVPIAPERPPAQRHSPTSVAAGERIEPKAGTLRARVLDAIRGAVDGLTDEEGQKLTGINPNTYRPRRVELWEAGWIVHRNRTRKVTSGNDAVVWYAQSADLSPACPECGHYGCDGSCADFRPD